MKCDLDSSIGTRVLLLFYFENAESNDKSVYHYQLCKNFSTLCFVMYSYKNGTWKTVVALQINTVKCVKFCKVLERCNRFEKFQLLKL